MVWRKTCDICGRVCGRENVIEKVFAASLNIMNYYDGVNEDPYDVSIDICKDCLMEKFDKHVIENGRIW